MQGDGAVTLTRQKLLDGQGVCTDGVLQKEPAGHDWGVEDPAGQKLVAGHAVCDEGVAQ